MSVSNTSSMKSIDHVPFELSKLKLTNGRNVVIPIVAVRMGVIQIFRLSTLSIEAKRGVFVMRCFDILWITKCFFMFRIRQFDPHRSIKYMHPKIIRTNDACLWLSKAAYLAELDWKHLVFQKTVPIRGAHWRQLVMKARQPEIYLNRRKIKQHKINN